MALVVVTLVTLIAGIAEVGFAFMRSSMITHAARDGARFGATLPVTGFRDANTGCFTGSAASDTIRDHVNEILDSAGFDGTIVTTQSCDGTVPTVEVNITGTLTMLFNLPFIGTSFDVDRSVVFEDEGRTGCAC
jgi:Flp pilus assembly protein TadG